MRRVLVYKCTHPHDPGIEGVFGNQDCMGQVRAFKYDVEVGTWHRARPAVSWFFDPRFKHVYSRPRAAVRFELSNDRGRRGAACRTDKRRSNALARPSSEAVAAANLNAATSF